MRQAGRFLPEYRQLRQKYSLSHLFHTPELAAEVTRLPLTILGVDAAILFSDILVITEVFGYEILFPDKGGVELRPPMQQVRLNVEEALHYVGAAITLLKPTLHVPLIGFCGGPYTVAKYMGQVKHSMLSQITEATIEYVLMQIKAGVDALQIFDSWAGLLDEDLFTALALPYLKKIVEAIRPTGIPVILFSRGSCRFKKELISLNPHAISFDWEEDMGFLRKQAPSHIAIQGNLDPQIFKGSPTQLEKKVCEILEQMKGEKGFIFNLGHGVLPETPVENALLTVRLIQQ
jgi:uroporphyrinogen decarboxylase